MTEQQTLLESQVREIYGRVVYTHKTHEKCADLSVKRGNCFKVAEIVLSALTTTTMLFVLFGNSKANEIIAALFSTLLLIITLYTKDFNLASTAEKHKVAALNILEIREALLSLLVDIKIGNEDIQVLQKSRDELLTKLVQVYKGSPSTNYQAYKMASDALKKYEDFTFTDSEIDKFLPPSLRRTK